VDGAAKIEKIRGAEMRIRALLTVVAAKGHNGDDGGGVGGTCA